MSGTGKVTRSQRGSYFCRLTRNLNPWSVSSTDNSSCFVACAQMGMSFLLPGSVVSISRVCPIFIFLMACIDRVMGMGHWSPRASTVLSGFSLYPPYPFSVFAFSLDLPPEPHYV